GFAVLYDRDKDNQYESLAHIWTASVARRRGVATALIAYAREHFPLRSVEGPLTNDGAALIKQVWAGDLRQAIRNRSSVPMLSLSRLRGIDYENQKGRLSMSEKAGNSDQTTENKTHNDTLFKHFCQVVGLSPTEIAHLMNETAVDKPQSESTRSPLRVRT